RLTRARSPLPAACGRSSGIGHIRNSIESRWVCPYVNACTKALDGGGTGQCSTAGSRSRSALRKAARLLKATAVPSINLTWNFTGAVCNQQGPPPQSVDKGCQIAIEYLLRDLLRDKSLPGPEWIGVVHVGLVRDEVLDKCGPSRPAIDPSSHFVIECDRPIQQQCSYGLVLEMARKHERFVHRGKIVAIRIETCAHAIDVAERGKELECSRKKASAVEEIDQPSCPGTDKVFRYAGRDDSAGIEQ